MKYQRSSFTVPVSEKISQEDWEGIFGTENERREKMREAIARQEEAKRRRRSGDVAQLELPTEESAYHEMMVDLGDRIKRSYGIPNV